MEDFIVGDTVVCIKTIKEIAYTIQEGDTFIITDIFARSYEANPPDVLIRRDITLRKDVSECFSSLAFKKVDLTQYKTLFKLED